MVEIRLIVIRSGATAPTAEPEPRWLLSPEGVDRAYRLREYIRNPKVDMALCSIHASARQTASIVGGLEVTDPRIVPSPELHPAPQTEEYASFRTAYEKLGERSLAEYQRHCKWPFLLRTSARAGAKLDGLIRHERDLRTGLFIGHGVFTSAILELTMRTLGWHSVALLQKLKNRVLGPCQGYDIKLEVGDLERRNSRFVDFETI